MSAPAISARWDNAVQARHHLNEVLKPWCKSQWMAGQRLHIEVRLHDDVKTDKQRAYYHGVVLKQITMQASPMGVKHGLGVWKEFFRGEFLGHKTQTTKNPITGKKSRRRVRVSTEDLGVKGYSMLIEKVTAFAVTELGVRFPLSWAEYEQADVDPETGEIHQPGAAQ